MRKKPRGRKYRNLYPSGSRIYYERLIEGKRFRMSTRTDDWDMAVQVRDTYEREKELVSLTFSRAEIPKFASFADRYLKEAMKGLAATTREDREGHLKADGRILATLGPFRLNEISRKTLLEWWTHSIEGQDLSFKTGKNYLDAISAVLNYARDLEIIERNPADDLRATLRRRSRTQKGRSARDSKIHPIEEPAELQAFLEASEAAAGDGHLADLLQLDAGLRLGEVCGLRWCDVWLGKDTDDTTRSITVEETRARGRHTGKPKSGRARKVAMSRRLRTLLRDRWMRDGQPKGKQRILQLDPSNYRNRHFAAVCKKAEIGKRDPKDLRDTYASQLLTAGIQLGYISTQLGHASIDVTARHYARWAGGDAYRKPLEVLEGEVPADLLARLLVQGEAAEISHSS